MKNLKISGEVADGITLRNLIEHRNSLQSGLDEDADLTPDDVVYQKQFIEAMTMVIDYYEGIMNYA